MRFFNTGGPCNPAKHYMLPATARLADENLGRLIETESYFVLHAPRQTGKTTAMLELARQLTASGRYASALVSMEVGAGFPGDVGAAEAAILNRWRSDLDFQLPTELRPPAWGEAPPGQRIGAALQQWSLSAQRPVAVFLDEIDALQNDVLISVLRQLRAGYYTRPTHFPASLALIGLRDVRDYKVASGGSERLQSPSPFNIAVRAIILRNFNLGEVRALLQQHTDETGQPFIPAAIEMIFALSQGQPWLVNALAKVVVEELAADAAQSITTEQVERAKELLIQRRQIHLDQLTDKLREARVRRVIEPIMAGGSLADIPRDDIDYVLDLGLCQLDSVYGLTIANPIYREILPRELSALAYASIPFQQPIWLKADGTFDKEQLLQAFLAFWRQHAQPLLRSVHYHEIAPHLVLMAFLDRVVNGGGILDREYAIGDDKMDLYLRYRGTRLGIELKIWREGRTDPRKQGLKQLDAYLQKLGLQTGWLVIFDQRLGQPDISKRTKARPAKTPSGRIVTLIRA